MHEDLIATYKSLGLPVPSNVVHCTCQFGDPRITALSNEFRWCICNSSSLYALEDHIRNGSSMIVKDYQICSTYIRALFKLAIL